MEKKTKEQRRPTYDPLRSLGEIPSPQSPSSNVELSEPVSNPTTQRFHTVFTRAVDVIGDEHKAMRWLGTPVRALNYVTPISLLDQPEGEHTVLAVLTRLEHGVF